MSAESAPAVPPEAIAAVGQHTVSKLSERALGRLTYQIGVGESGAVYLTVTDNEGGGYFSKEPVAIDKIASVLADPGHRRVLRHQPAAPVLRQPLQQQRLLARRGATSPRITLNSDQSCSRS